VRLRHSKWFCYLAGMMMGVNCTDDAMLGCACRIRRVVRQPRRQPALYRRVRTFSWIRSVAELQEWEKARRTWRGRLKGGNDQREIAGHEPVK
jgi:hypothetical protein